MSALALETQGRGGGSWSCVSPPFLCVSVDVYVHRLCESVNIRIQELSEIKERTEN